MSYVETQDETQRGTRINRVLAQNPPGVPMTSGWLALQRVSPQLLQGYKNSGWLSPIGRGAWMRAGTEPTLSGSIYALQRQRSVTVYPAACTVLGYQGRLHYLPLGASPVLQLAVGSDRKLPQWFTRQPFAANLRVLNADALFEPVSAGVTDWQAGEFSLEISSPERAMLEYCYLLPNHADFEEARQLMEGLATLRPEMVQSILLACRSVKAKRLFLALAEIVGHEWYRELNLESVKLGSGSRHIVSGGLWNSRFKITVPEIWMDS